MIFGGTRSKIVRQAMAAATTWTVLPMPRSGIASSLDFMSAGRFWLDPEGTWKLNLLIVNLLAIKAFLKLHHNETFGQLPLRL